MNFLLAAFIGFAIWPLLALGIRLIALVVDRDLSLRCFMENLFWLWFWIGAIGGVAATVWAADFSREAVQTTGVIVELVSRAGDGDEENSVRPRVAYVDQEGAEHSVIPSLNSEPMVLEVGESVNVTYRRSHPEKMFVGRSWGVWLAPVFLFSMVPGAFLGRTLLFSRAEHHRIKQDQEYAELRGAAGEG